MRSSMLLAQGNLRARDVDLEHLFQPLIVTTNIVPKHEYVAQRPAVCGTRLLAYRPEHRGRLIVIISTSNPHDSTEPRMLCRGWYKVPPMRFPQASSASTLPLRLLQSFVLRPGASLRPVIFIVSIKPTSFIMFVKTAAFFLALVAFVNAIPVTEYRRMSHSSPNLSFTPFTPTNLGPRSNSPDKVGVITWPVTGQGVQILAPEPPQIGTQAVEPANGIWKRESSLGFDTDADIDILKSPPTTPKPPPPPHGAGGSRAPVEPGLDFRIGVPIVHPKRGFFAQLTSSFKRLGRILTGRDVVDKQIIARSAEIDPEYQILANDKHYQDLLAHMRHRHPQ
ncbi:hypothetical protein BDM02DRAFT_2983647 [Thelephora ganbajun]|uniref:Uncharacterized protein n=1 Tax=Thelephora ganbajun TaxID=370292 RepID=A0ACB6ZBD2_THEGA|nr:hypothetical protein BDM02DRAFT_2983647 [Thelephora ganbajun]